MAPPEKGWRLAPDRRWDQHVHRDLRAFACGAEARRVRARQEEEGGRIQVAAQT